MNQELTFLGTITSVFKGIRLSGILTEIEAGYMFTMC